MGDTFLIVETAGNVIVQAVGGAVHRQFVVLQRSAVVEYFIYPVDVGARKQFVVLPGVDADLDKLDQYCGEAYFARALAYSELIKLFCKAYESDEEAANELGVILTEHYNGNEEMKRASLKDSYQFVLDDLNRAADLLKLEDDFKGTLYDTTYFNEYTVYALRARIALYMKKWDDAIKYFISNGQVSPWLYPVV